MYAGKYVFAQVMEHLPMHVFRKCIRRHGGNRYVKSFPCLSQFPCMAFAQLTHRESLRDIEIGLRAHSGKLCHMGIRGGFSRNTLANANARRDWRMHAEFAQEPIRIAPPCTRRTTSDWNSTTPSSPSTPRRWTCACPSSRGRCSVRRSPE